MKYIQRKDHHTKQLETVSECETLKEAKLLLVEYQISDLSADYYISSRCCKDWRDRD